MKDLYEFNNIRAFLIITGTLLFFYLYHYFSLSVFLKKVVNRYYQESRNEFQLFLFRKISGFMILGILPLLFYILLLDGSFNRFGFSLNHFINSLHIIVILIIVIGILIYFRHKKYPDISTIQIEAGQWTTNLFMYNFLGWCLYLLAYEFLFRGILLFECYEIFGFWPAIAINITIYSAIHMVNGKSQAFGALFFGSIACYFALTKGTILIPFFMHIALTAFSDYFTIKMNPDYKFVINKSV